MKNSLVIILSMVGIAQAHADIEVAAGLKLYGVLDQAVQSQELKDPNSATAGQKNMWACTPLPPRAVWA